MSETKNIADIAQLVARELLVPLGWRRGPGPEDHDWPCHQPDTHGIKTHPADCTWLGVDGFSGQDTILLFDLKSYSSTTLEQSDLSIALNSLAKATGCANVGPDFAERYGKGDEPEQVIGVLFVYCHNGEEDPARWEEQLRHVSTTFEPEEQAPILLIGPPQICFLHGVASFITGKRAEWQTTGATNGRIEFYTPGGMVRPVPVEFAKNLAPECLCAPWIVCRAEQGPSVEYILFYEGPGSQVEEFSFLLEMLVFRSILKRGNLVKIALVGQVRAPEARRHLDIAKERYAERFGEYESSARADLLDNLGIEVPSDVRKSFSSINLGMTRG